MNKGLGEVFVWVGNLVGEKIKNKGSGSFFEGWIKVIVVGR